MIQKNEPLSSKDFKKGLVTRSDILNPDPEQSPNCMDVKWFFDGAIGKRMGASSTNTIQIGSTSAAGWTIDSNGTLSTSLQSYWKLDESGSTRFDAFDSLPLADVNTTGSIVGIRGNAGLFVATASNALAAANTATIQTGNVNFSISSWFYLNSTSNAPQTIVSKRDPDVDAGTTLLLHCDGTNGSTTFTDSSPSGKAITAGGNAQITTAQFKFGTGSALFDGTGDSLSAADSPDWDFGSGDFTMECFIRFNAITACAIFSRADGSEYDLQFLTGGNRLRFVINGSTVKTENWDPSLNTWYHLAVCRKSSSLRFFVDGSEIGTTTTNSDSMAGNNAFFIGADLNGNKSLNGWLDEIRVSSGVGRYAAAFTAPTVPFATQNYEYWLYVNTNNNATFRVSSSGSNNTATVQATSIGALNTSTWYNVVAWHSNNSHIGISVNLSLNTAVYVGGLSAGVAPFVLGALSDGAAGAATTFMDGRIDETGFWKKILSAQERSDLYGGGTGNTFSGGQSGFGWGMFDFGASNIRWLMVAAGTGIVASSNLGTTFVNVTTSRTQNYQYFERSKNVLIATSDAYDQTLFWAGSATTFAQALAVGSAPNAKYAINYQGFLILLNSSARKRGFFYADENLQLTDPWTSAFDYPSSADDEITAPFVLSKFLYVSTRYRIFFTSFVGGNPDWTFRKVKDWGFVPRTVKIATVKGSQVAIGMDWQRRIRVFDGYDDLFVSDNVENINGLCEFGMNKVSYAGSGLVVSHAEVDLVEQEYRLNLAIGLNSSQTTHAIVLNLRTLALYPYSNQNYQAMCVAESNNQQHLMAIDRSGFVHILNSGNLDVSKPINDTYYSPVLFKGIPGSISKSQNNSLYFKVDSCGAIYYQDALNLSNVMSTARQLANLTGSEQVVQAECPLDIPATFNTYQFAVTSSSGKANPWKMTRWDFLQDQKGIGKG